MANSSYPGAARSQRSDFKISKSAKKKRVFKTDVRTNEKQTKAERMESGNDMMNDSIEANTEAAVQQNSGKRRKNAAPPQKKESSGKIKFPLIANDDSLERLLGDMIGPDEAKKVMFASDHASFTIDGTEMTTGREFNVGGNDVNAMLFDDQTTSNDDGEKSGKPVDVMSAAPKLEKINYVARRESASNLQRA